MWNAAWLQEHMRSHWRENNTLLDDTGEPLRLQQFALAIVGAGGTGMSLIEQFLLWQPDHIPIDDYSMRHTHAANTNNSRKTNTSRKDSERALSLAQQRLPTDEEEHLAIILISTIEAALQCVTTPRLKIIGLDLVFKKRFEK